VRLALWILVAGAVAIAGCGDEPAATAKPEPTATPKPRATATPTAEPVRRATSTRACLALWNADEAIGSSYQVSHTDFLADLARAGRTPVRVSYERRTCYVTAKVGPRRIAWFAAANGRAPYTNPKRRNLEPNEYVPYNGRALRDGRIEMR
jgi:hypothetical protein